MLETQAFKQNVFWISNESIYYYWKPFLLFIAWKKYIIWLSDSVTHPYKLYCNIFNAYDMQYDYAIGLYIYLLFK